MRLPVGRNQRFDFGSRALHYIGLGEIAIVGQQCFGPAELFRQSVDLLQHRRDLLLVVGRLNHCRGDLSPAATLAPSLGTIHELRTKSSLSLLLCHPKAEAARLVVIDELDSGLFERCLNFEQS